MKRKLKLFLALFFIGAGAVMAQAQVRGTVTDENGEPVIGASVVVKGTNIDDLVYRNGYPGSGDCSQPSSCFER